MLLSMCSFRTFPICFQLCLCFSHIPFSTQHKGTPRLMRWMQAHLIHWMAADHPSIQGSGSVASFSTVSVFCTNVALSVKYLGTSPQII